MKLDKMKRRTVIKGIGVGVGSGVAVSGTVTASCTPDEVIEIKDNDFSRDPTFTLSDGESILVDFVNKDPVDHNVAIHEHGDTSDLVRSAALSPFSPGDTYQIQIADDGNDSTFTVEETNCYGHAGEEKQRFSAGYENDSNHAELHVHCDFHNAGISDNDPAEMEGTINVNQA